MPADGARPLSLNLFFDVDGALITPDGALRPHVHAVFHRLQADGHRLFLWSGAGPRLDVARSHRLQRYLAGLYSKPLADFCASLPAFTPLRPDFVIDDYPEIVRALGGIQVRPAGDLRDDDREMWRVYRAVSRYAQERRDAPTLAPRPLP